MDKKVKPAFQLREYYPHEVCRVVDRYQSYLYMKHGVMPCDIYLSPDKENTIFVFFKSETKELYEKYRRFELK